MIRLPARRSLCCHLSSLLFLFVFAGIFAGVVAGVEAQVETIEFTVTEATWMSLDLSPDGESLVFELLGDIYRLPVTGGVAQPLLTGSAFQSQPRFSPNGTTLVYISDASGSDNVWLANADGSQARALTDLPRALMWSPTWSADGNSIFVSVVAESGPRAAEIWRFFLPALAEHDGFEAKRVVENENGPQAFLVSTPAPGAYGPVTSPDGTGLLYTSVTPRPYGSRNGGSSRIVWRDLETGESRAIPAGGVNPMKPGLTPDGELLVYAAESQGRTGLRVRRLADGEERWLTRELQRHQLEGRATRDVLPNFAISPDGRFVFAAYGGQIHRLRLEPDDRAGDESVADGKDGKDTVVRFEARVSLETTKTLDFPQRLDDAPVRARRLQQPALGPGNRLAFSALARIYVADARTGAARRLTTTQRAREFMPAWSPDGRWVAFVTWDEEGGHLFKARVDDLAGGAAVDPIRLSLRPALFLDPVVSPDGRHILALAAPLTAVDTWRGQFPPGGAPDGVRLVEFPAEPPGRSSAEVERVVADAAGLRHPHFLRVSELSAGERRIFASSAAGLVSLASDGSERRIEASLPRQMGPASWRMSPSGEAVLARAGERLLRFSRPSPDSAELDPAQAVPVTQGGDTGFTWAPDGDRVAWFRGATLLARGESEPPFELALDVSAPRARPSGVVVLRGGKVVTMRGYEIFEDADLVVENNRIRSVAPRESAPVPTTARIIDVSGKTIVPGFIDVHAHSAPPLELLEPESAMAFANLSFGVTALRNPQSPPDIFALADIVDVDGVPSPRIFSTGPGIELSPFGGGGNYLAPSFASLEEVRTSLRKYRDVYGTHLLKSYLIGNRQQRQWVVQASRELGMMPTTEGGADTKANMTHAIDGFSGNEHAFPVAPIHDDLVQLIARTGITYTPTLVVSFGAALPVYRLLAEKRPHLDPRLARWFDVDALYNTTQTRVLWFPPEAYNDLEVADGARKILEAGGRVALGGHGEAQGLSNHWEMELLERGGMEPHDVLRVATIFGAEALGFGQDLGSLESGKLADLVVLDRDPLADIANTKSIQYVMKNGVLYDSLTLDQIWPEARPLARPWWLEP